MRYKYWVLAIGFLVLVFFFARKKYKHVVSKGETITKIAEQYHVRTSAIYELNQLGIKYKSVLLIPITIQSSKPQSDIVAAYPSKTHTVLDKNPLWHSKQYGVTS
jgi:LysM repeat protein